MAKKTGIAGVWSGLKGAIRELLSKSLTDTTPMYVKSGNLKTDVDGYAFQALSDTDFTTLKLYNEHSDSDDLSTMKVKKGMTVTMHIRDIEINTGDGIVHTH